MKLQIRSSLVIILLLLISAITSTSFAQWSNDPTVNNPICTSLYVQEFPTVASDGAGGAIITWQDHRGTGYNVFAQRINSSGVVQWTTNGFLIGSEPSTHPTIISDGSSGAIITWAYYLNQLYRVYAQRINAAGVEQWASGGIPICTLGRPELSTNPYPQIIGDDVGGAIITWKDFRSGGVEGNIYAQRINANGDTLWQANGVPICTATSSQVFTMEELGTDPIKTQIIASDGASGAIITWTDYRSSTWTVYAQRVNSAGIVQWTTDGVALTTAGGSSTNSRIVSDGSGGAIITWADNRITGTYNDIYAQRLNSSGVAQWTANGVEICTAGGPQQVPDIVEDGTGGAFITWQDSRIQFDIFYNSIYAQRVNSSGVVQWTANGVQITFDDLQYKPVIVSDGSGGAIIAWEDIRNATDYNVYAQRINSSGIAQWTVDGVPIATYTPDNTIPPSNSALIGLGDGSAIITWVDGRNVDFTSDIYASKVFSDGTLQQPTTFQLTVNIEDSWNMVSVPGLHPLDQNVNTWWAYRDPSANVFKYNGGYQSVTTVTPGTGYWMKHSGSRTYNTGDEWPSSGILFVTHDPISANAGWNLVGGYEEKALTSGITTTPPGLQEGFVYGYSSTSGYTVADTLIPGYGYWIKLTGAGQINIPAGTDGSSTLAKYFDENWGRITITDNTGKNYTLYGINGDVNLNNYELPPVALGGLFDVRYGSGRFAEDLSEGQQTIQMQGVTYPVKVKVENMTVTLQDETGKEVNAGLKAGEEITISNSSINKLLVISGEAAAPIEYSLDQNYPNPFNPSTIIKLSIPEATQVTLNIYNILGEKVAQIVNSKLDAGKYSYQWDAGNVASGLYIYELRTDKFVSTKKMMFLK